MLLKVIILSRLIIFNKTIKGIVDSSKEYVIKYNKEINSINISISYAKKYNFEIKIKKTLYNQLFVKCKTSLYL